MGQEDGSDQPGKLRGLDRLDELDGPWVKQDGERTGWVDQRTRRA